MIQFFVRKKEKVNQYKFKKERKIMNKLKQFMYRFGGTICAIAAFMAVYTDGRCGWKIYQPKAPANLREFAERQRNN